MSAKRLGAASVLGMGLVFGALRGCEEEDAPVQEPTSVHIKREGRGDGQPKVDKSGAKPHALSSTGPAVHLTGEEVDDYKDLINPRELLVVKLRGCIDGETTGKKDLDCTNSGGEQMWCKNPNFPASSVDFYTSEAQGEGDFGDIVTVKVGETTTVYPVDVYTGLDEANGVLTDICLTTRKTLQDLDPTALCNPETPDAECQRVVDKTVDDGGTSVYYKEFTDGIVRELEGSGLSIERTGPFEVNVGGLQMKVENRNFFRIAPLGKNISAHGYIARSKEEMMEILESGELPIKTP